jgi:hypothetical protein
MATLTGGDKAKKYLDHLAGQFKAGEPYVKVGFLSGATYPDGTSVALVAAVNEFGAPSRGQPPRPFFRNMIAAKQGGWSQAVANLMKANHNDVAKALDLTGQAIKGQLQQSIIDFTDPPLKASTIKAKGFDKPLIDTSHMLNSADYEVVA